MLFDRTVLYTLELFFASSLGVGWGIIDNNAEFVQCSVKGIVSRDMSAPVPSR